MQHIPYTHFYVLCFLYHFMIPKPQHSEPMPHKPGIPFRIVTFLFQVLPAIQFDCHTRFQACEIQYVATHRMLPAKLELAHLL